MIAQKFERPEVVLPRCYIMVRKGKKRNQGGCMRVEKLHLLSNVVFLHDGEKSSQASLDQELVASFFGNKVRFYEN